MKKQPPNILVSVWTSDAVERVALSHANSFSYQIYGPQLNLDRFFAAYLKGENAPLPPFNINSLTPFTKKVLEALANIPFGESSTYGELAAQIGIPSGARAVGSALGRNPIPFILPCHRVLAQNGIGGFSIGLKLKKLLLNYESLF